MPVSHDPETGAVLLWTESSTERVLPPEVEAELRRLQTDEKREDDNQREPKNTSPSDARLDTP